MKNGTKYSQEYNAIVTLAAIDGSSTDPKIVHVKDFLDSAYTATIFPQIVSALNATA